MLKMIFGSSVMIVALVACGSNGGGVDTNTTTTDSLTQLAQTQKVKPSKPHFEVGEFGEIELSRSYTLPSDALFIDVRNDWERAKGYAAGSVGGVVYEYRKPNGNGSEDYGHREVRTEAFVDEVLQKVNGDKNKHIILICASSSRTKKASKLLADNGFRYIEHILGGFSKWNELDLPLGSTQK